MECFYQYDPIWFSFQIGDVQRFLCLFQKWEIEAWRIKEVGPRKRSYIPLPSHGNCFILSSIWPYADSLSFLSKVSRCFFFFFSQCLRILHRPWFHLPSVLFSLKSHCLVPERDHATTSQARPQWRQGSWILNVELLGPSYVLPFLLEPPQHPASHPMTPTIFFCSDIVIHQFPLTSAPEHVHRSRRIPVKRDRSICRQAF